VLVLRAPPHTHSLSSQCHTTRPFPPTWHRYANSMLSLTDRLGSWLSIWVHDRSKVGKVATGYVQN
jgi:hypothetical protein